MPDSDIDPFDPRSKAARKKYFEIYGGVTVANWRMFIALAAVCVIAVLEGVAIAVMSPLKTIQPYVIKTEASGRVTVDPMAAQKYIPGQAEIDYTISKWVRNLLSIDKYMTGNPQRNNVLDAYAMTREKAVQEFADWFAISKPIDQITRDPTLVRTVTVRNVLHVQDGALIVPVTIETRSTKSGVKSEKQMVTVHYVVSPPTTEQEILENPLGIFVTHFEISRDLT